MGTLPLITGDITLAPKKHPGRGRWFYFLFLGVATFLISPLFATNNISGLVLDLGGNPIQNVEIKIGGIVKDVTNPSGAYTILNLPSGLDYTVYASKPGLVFTPSTRTYINLTSDQTDQNFTYGKVWGGGGVNNLASNPANWVEGEAPVALDAVLFSSTASTKACFWDLTVQITSFTIAVDYSSTVAAVADMDLHYVEIAGGLMDFGSNINAISGSFNQTGGTFTFTPAGRMNFDGGTPQTLRMVISDLGSGNYASYFGSVWLKGTSVLTLASDVIIDGALNMDAGMDFNLGNSTLTLTGGRLTGAGPGSPLNWDDSSGLFHPGTGMVRFFNSPRNYRINQRDINSFNNLTIDGDYGVDVISNIKVLGKLQVGQASRPSQFTIGPSYQIEVFGQTNIGPTSTPLASAMTIGSEMATFHGDVILGTATLSLNNSFISFQGASFKVTKQGTLSLLSGTPTINFNDSSSFLLEGGTFVAETPAVFKSTAPGVTRFSMQLNGAVDIQQGLTLNSLDKNGMRLGAGSNPMHLESLKFQNGIDGGAAVNFDPVTIATTTVSNPEFDASISTNVRAIFNPVITPAASVNIIDPTGAHNSYTYEYDPNNIINWGVIGTPFGFSGTPVGASSVSWNWSLANHPIGFVVKSSSGGNMSPTLPPKTVSWIETGLSTNTQYTRYVSAFVDIGSAISNSDPKYSLAVAVASASFTSVQVTSVTVSWNPNTNPANTIFRLERSVNGIDFSTAGTGTYAALNPFTESGLSQYTTYFYRIRSINGDGAVTPQSLTISTMTRPVPPPVVISITPNTAPNFGNISFSVHGDNFQTGASLVFRKNATQIITPASLTLVNASTFTGTINLLGAYASTWDVYVANPDGTMSSNTGHNIFTVTNSSSQGNITIKDYTSTLALNFFTTDSKTEIRVPAGAMSSGRFYVSVDPLTDPLQATPANINSAIAANAGWIYVPGSLREAMAFENIGPHVGGFNQQVSIAINYPDANNDGTVDSINLRSSNLILMTLNSSTGRWQALAGSVVDKPNKRVAAPADHFSVFALFGSPAAADLSDVKIYPNPWRPQSGTMFDSNAVTISGLTQDGKINFYSIDAQLINQMDFNIGNAGSVTWDGKNGKGQKVGSGVYLIHIESGTGDKKTFKLGIER